MPQETCNIMIAGVGGQGTVMASRVLARAAIRGGYDVKVSEVHGMAQRGGSVVSEVRLGEKVYSPLIPAGEADYIVAFEKLEARRWYTHLRSGGILLVNDQAIEPAPVLLGRAEYPPRLLDRLYRDVCNVRVINAVDIARECGTVRAVNTVLLGLLSRDLPLAEEDWLASLEENIPEAYTANNLAAFRAGRGCN